jgi:hypothetical protein
MKAHLKTFNIVGALAAFMGLPVLLYIPANFSQRSLLKESLSLMMSQFFLARSNKSLQNRSVN